MRYWKAWNWTRRPRRWCSSVEHGLEIACFDDLLLAARAQPEPQRLLFVFAGASLPEDATPGQRARFAAGQGGALVPLMSVDKDPEALVNFESLAGEADGFGCEWAVVFVAAMAGRNGEAPSAAAADRSLERMIDRIKAGAIDGFIPFDRAGRPLLLD